MGNKPKADRCALVVEHEQYSVRLSRVGKGPLVLLWVHEDGNGGRGIILDVKQSDVVIEGWQDLLDEIEEDMKLDTGSRESVESES